MSLQLEIITPEGKMLDVVADEVTVPGKEGEFGVLPGRLPVLAATQTGLVSYKRGGETKMVAIGGGFAEVLGDKISLLTDSFTDREHVDPVAVHQELNEAQAEFDRAVSRGDLQNGIQDDPKLRALIAQMNWLVTELELCGEAPVALVRLLEDQGVRTPSGHDPDVYNQGQTEEQQEETT